MAVARHPSSLIITNLPNKALVGIDLLSLTSSPRFGGFTTLPPGWHFLFVGATAEYSSRQGFWFHVAAPEDEAPPSSATSQAGQKRARADSQPLGVRGAVVAPTPPAQQQQQQQSATDWLAILTWDEQREELVPVEGSFEVTEWRQKLLADSILQKGLFPYRQSILPDDSPRIQEVSSVDETSKTEALMDFPSLTRHISARVLNRIFGGQGGGGFWGLSTGSSTVFDAESEKIPGIDGADFPQDRPLGLLDIDLKKTWPDDALGRQRTEGARDRSWRLGQVITQSESLHSALSNQESKDAKGEELKSQHESVAWGSSLLGEMQFCFLMVLTLANWSCMAQWRRILELVLTCQSAIPDQPLFFVEFLGILRCQLLHNNVVDGGLFDVDDGGGDFLKELLRRFVKILMEFANDSETAGTSSVMARMDELQEAVRDLWGWELGDAWLRKGMVQLEDGEMVELETQDMEDEDERGEYAPVVVDLGGLN